MTVFAGTAIAAELPPGEPNFTHGVASGDVTSSAAILWTRVDRRTTVKAEVWDNPGLTGKKAFQRTIKTVPENDFTVKVDATGLNPGTTYHYRFRHEDFSSSPVGTFKTAPDPSTPADVHFAYTGDSDGTRVNGSPFFNNFETLDRAREAGIDFFGYLGDTIYSDSSLRTTGPATTLDEYRGAYKENRTIQATTDLFEATSIYAQPDDHEVQNDYDGQTVSPSRYANGIRAFLEYMPVRTTGLLQDSTCAGDPLYRTFKWGSEADVFILDERSCRSADVAPACIATGGPFAGAPDLGPTLPPAVRGILPFAAFLTQQAPAGCLSAIFDPSRTMLGPVQKAKFKQDLLNSTAQHKIVLSQLAIQQFFALPYDRWEGYGAERNEVLNFILNNGIDNVEFLTTDNHANLVNEVFRDRYENCPLPLAPNCTVLPTYIANELVTGPIATNTLQAEIIGGFGASAVFAFNSVLTRALIDCRDLDTYSWGDVQVDATAGTTQVTLKDDTGAGVVNQVLPPVIGFPCQKTLGP